MRRHRYTVNFDYGMHAVKSIMEDVPKWETYLANLKNSIKFDN